MNKNDYERLGYVFDGFGRWATEEELAMFTEDEKDASCIVFINDKEVIEPLDFDIDEGWVEFVEYVENTPAEKEQLALDNLPDNKGLEAGISQIVNDTAEASVCSVERVIHRIEGKVRVLSVRAANRLSMTHSNRFWEKAEKLLAEESKKK